jgi:hypothetical protein
MPEPTKVRQPSAYIIAKNPGNPKYSELQLFRPFTDDICFHPPDQHLSVAFFLRLLQIH